MVLLFHFVCWGVCCWVAWERRTTSLRSFWPLIHSTTDSVLLLPSSFVLQFNAFCFPYYVLDFAYFTLTNTNELIFLYPTQELESVTYLHSTIKIDLWLLTAPAWGRDRWWEHPDSPGLLGLDAVFSDFAFFFYYYFTHLFFVFTTPSPLPGRRTEAVWE